MIWGWFGMLEIVQNFQEFKNWDFFCNFLPKNLGKTTHIRKHSFGECFAPHLCLLLRFWGRVLKVKKSASYHLKFLTKSQISDPQKRSHPNVIFFKNLKKTKSKTIRKHKRKRDKRTRDKRKRHKRKRHMKEETHEGKHKGRET